MPKTILVPTDFSEGASAAMQHAEILAKATDCEIDVIHVEPGNVLPHGESDVFDKDEPRIRELLEQASPRDPGITCHHTLRRGNPPDEILKYAKSKQVDMIVMGTHGQSKSPNVHAGKIAQLVLEQADFPVITVKRPLSLIVSS